MASDKDKPIYIPIEDFIRVKGKGGLRLFICSESDGGNSCSGCDMITDLCKHIKCSKYDRKDYEDVVFIEIEY